MKAFYVYGYNGSYLELSDGRFIDSVEGTMSEHFENDSREPSEILSSLLDELYKDNSIIWTSEEDWKKWGRANLWNDINEYVDSGCEESREEGE